MGIDDEYISEDDLAQSYTDNVKLLISAIINLPVWTRVFYTAQIVNINTKILDSRNNIIYSIKRCSNLGFWT